MSHTAEPKARTPDFIIREATVNDLSSLSTIFPRSFHTVNPFMKACWPDTPSVRSWWTRAFSSAINHPDAHPLVAIHRETETVVGICSIRLMQPEDAGAGIWDADGYPYVSEIDSERLRPAIEGIIEGRKRAFPPGRGNTPNFLVELLGVDEAWKGFRLGRRLLEKVEQVVDDAGAPAFVEANAKAKGFYVKFGFRETGRMSLEGVDGVPYVEVLMAREARGR